MGEPPPDAPARLRIERDLQSTLVVQAGAGSGKTTALVGRVLALVTGGRAELRSIAAITFTDKAAAELRDRIREELERRVAQSGDGPADEVVAARCAVALEQLDGAAIGTLHAFAQRILVEHPMEAGLPPRLEVLDEVSSAVAFDRRWVTFREQLLTDPRLARSILLLLASGVRPDALRVLAQTFGENWDLVAERVPSDAPEPPPVHRLLGPVLLDLEAICAEPCDDDGDLLRVRLDDIARYASALWAIEDELDLLEALGEKSPVDRPGFRVGNIGKKAAYGCDLAALRERVRAAGDALEAVRTGVAADCARRIGGALGRFTLEAAAERRRAGELEFHDLLVLARALLTDPVHGAAVRSALHRRYAYLLLDEFQDTDPIQVELAVRIAALDPHQPAAGSARWTDVPVAPGHLFIVGDPKQSIYRFRRADVATFLTAAGRFGDEGGAVELTANFRTAAPIVDWVNATFAALLGEPDDVDTPVPSQPAFVALRPTRSAMVPGPAVAVLGRTEHGARARADELRSAEADDVAATILRIVAEGWAVDAGAGASRAARLGDVAVLVPSRTSLPFLEAAFDRAGIAFRAESSALVYSSRAVRDLLTVLRAVDDPSDDLQIVSALRTPLLGCGDDDLFRFRWERSGRWSYLAEQPGSVPADDPVRTALGYLRVLHEARHWLAPSELLDRIARDRRAYELGFVEGRPRDVWRRLRFVVDQARQWTEATGGTLRQYLRWVRQQTAEGARVAEAVLPETDDDAVRVMTIHSAKGLEFPVTILSGTSTAPGNRPAAAQVVFPANGPVGYRMGKNVVTDEYLEWAPVDEQMGLHERMRLLYVACTRARDHLVVSLHRRARAKEPSRGRRTNAELLLAGMGEVIDALPDAVPDGSVPHPPGAPAAADAPPPFAAWEAERTAALATASRRTAVAATALGEDGRLDAGHEPDAGLDKGPRDLDLPPWLKGRYGTSVGRAVHGVLQTVDLGSAPPGDPGLDAAVRAQCEAEAVVDRTEDVRRLVAGALRSPSVRDGARSPHWREVYVCTPVGDRLLEGYIDLLYRTPGGLVVVDYKTAASSDPAELDRRVDTYRSQGAAYALMVGAATGERVARVTFVFLTPDGPRERHLDDLVAAVADARALVDAGGAIAPG
ncbi:MAG TPA: UvrD-helicase domain-containing protein [Acidimicrobiales bacterium]